MTEIDSFLRRQARPCALGMAGKTGVCVDRRGGIYYSRNGPAHVHSGFGRGGREREYGARRRPGGYIKEEAEREGGPEDTKEETGREGGPENTLRKRRNAETARKIHKEETERGDGPENTKEKTSEAGAGYAKEEGQKTAKRRAKERRRAGKRKDNGDLIGGSGPRYFFCAQRSGGGVSFFL